jgi:pyruvate/2-oxoglutarate dehydrogenase complex dihydrolipoamide acyltransferase (E2) component
MGFFLYRLFLKWECFFPYTEKRTLSFHFIGIDKAMKFLRIIFLVSIFLSFHACAMVDSATKEMTPQQESTVPRVYYAGVADLKMFSQGKASEAPIAELPLHEKVLRYKLERGFAYVKVVRTGQMGWVRNADLVWRKRTPSKKAAKKTTPPQEKAEAAPENTPEVNHDPNPELERRDASMFDAL